MPFIVPGWQQLSGEEATLAWESSKPIIACWQGPGDNNLCVYADGQVEVDGLAPVELLAHALVSWHSFQRQKEMS